MEFLPWLFGIVITGGIIILLFILIPEEAEWIRDIRATLEDPIRSRILRIFTAIAIVAIVIVLGLVALAFFS